MANANIITPIDALTSQNPVTVEMNSASNTVGSKLIVEMVHIKCRRINWLELSAMCSINVTNVMPYKQPAKARPISNKLYEDIWWNTNAVLTGIHATAIEYCKREP